MLSLPVKRLDILPIYRALPKASIEAILVLARGRFSHVFRGIEEQLMSQSP
jgi:hypothetical protein